MDLNTQVLLIPKSVYLTTYLYYHETFWNFRSYETLTYVLDYHAILCKFGNKVRRLKIVGYNYCFVLPAEMSQHTDMDYFS